MNPPYSQATPAVYKAIHEFLRGANVVLLLPFSSIERGPKYRWIRTLGIVDLLGPVEFIFKKTDGRALRANVCLVYLLQPAVLARLRCSCDIDAECENK